MAQNLSARVATTGGGAPPTVAGLINSLRPEMARVLPGHLDADRLARIALTVLRRTPDLARCDPNSFMGALMSAAQLGLEPGVSAECYLVPRRNKGAWECTLVLGYQGLAKLAWQSGQIAHLDAQAVYADDEFTYSYGLAPTLVHRPAMTRSGAPVAFYACATLTAGGSSFVVLSPEDVRALRGTSRGSSIPDPMHWMERKTALRQLLKLLPKSATLARAVAADESVRTDLRPDALDEPDPAPALPAPAAVEGPDTGAEAPPAEGGPYDVTDAVVIGDADPDADDTAWPDPATPGEGAGR